MFLGPKEGKSGDELTWVWLNALRRALKRATVNCGVNSGLAMDQNDAGTFLRVSPAPQGASLAVTNGTITARSGTTPGTGSVFLAVFGGTSIAVDGSQAITVWSLSSTTGGIATGTYCWIQQDSGGNWWIVTVDCGN